MKVFIWQKQRKRMRACPHADTYAMLTQLKRQHWARKHPNIIRNFLSATQSPPPHPLVFLPPLLPLLQRQPIFCAAAHYAGWWLSPCQLTVQLAYPRLAQTLIPAGERTVYTYWCPHSYALACTSLIVKQLWHMRKDAECKLSAPDSDVSRAIASLHKSKTLVINVF